MTISTECMAVLSLNKQGKIMSKHYDDPFLSDKRNRSGLHFIGNTPELDKEFKRIRAGLPPETQTSELHNHMSNTDINNPNATTAFNQPGHYEDDRYKHTGSAFTDPGHFTLAYRIWRLKYRLLSTMDQCSHQVLICRTGIHKISRAIFYPLRRVWAFFLSRHK